MKLIYSNFRKGEAKIRAENLDDLWYLSSIIDENDFVKGGTFRKVKVGNNEGSQIIKKPVFLEIKVTKVEFSKHSPLLRVSGIISQAPDDIPLGEHHTFNVETGTEITIRKEKWLRFQIERINEACLNKVSTVLICVLDREEAYFALMKKYGYELLSRIKGDVKKKGDDNVPRSDFYSELAKLIKDYSSRYSLTQIIIASPAFWKEELIKNLDISLKPKIISASCSSASLNGVDEVLKRPEVKEALKRERASEEMNLVEQLLVEISSNGLGAYGIIDVENAVSMGAISQLLVTDSFIQKARAENFYSKIESMMKSVDNANGDIIIVSSEHDGGKKLDGLGGVGALLRFKVRY